MSIAIGALVAAKELDRENLAILKQLGFESIGITFWETLGETDLLALAKLVEKADMQVSALSVWGNPLANSTTAEGWRTLIEHASQFGSPFVTGFAGRVPNTSVEESLPAWKDLFSDLLERAHQHDCKGLLMENCRIGDVWKRGKWNIAINDDAWKLLFTTLDDEKLGLEWEPCHQVEALVEPIAQLGRWIHKIKHIHGKDTHVDWAQLSTYGLYAKQKAITTTLPGLGDTDWRALCAFLTRTAYQGSIDVETEGSSFFDDLETKAQALSYLKTCRS